MHKGRPETMSSVPTMVRHVIGCGSPSNFAVIPVKMNVRAFVMGATRVSGADPSKKLKARDPDWLIMKGTEKRQLRRVRTIVSSFPAMPVYVDGAAADCSEPAPANVVRVGKKRPRTQTAG